MVEKHNLSYCDVINMPLLNNQNQLHDSGSVSAAINSSTSSYDLLAQNLSAHPPMNASFSIKLDHNNYLV